MHVHAYSQVPYHGAPIGRELLTIGKQAIVSSRLKLFLPRLIVRVPYGPASHRTV